MDLSVFLGIPKETLNWFPHCEKDFPVWISTDEKTNPLQDLSISLVFIVSILPQL